MNIHVPARTLVHQVAISAALLATCPRDTAAQAERPGLPPPGLGTLRQEDVAVRLDGGAVQLQIIPLDELILRLLAPDSYAALNGLVQSRRDEITEAGERWGVAEPVVFLLTVFATVEQAQFDPEQFTIESRNMLFRPIAILPISPLWNQHRLAQRETATAIYVFEDGLALLEPFAVLYGSLRSETWRQRLRRIEQERARIEGRIRGVTHSPHDPDAT